MDFECESGNCGSTSFHAGEDGFTYCSEGHQQFSRGTQLAEENEGAPQFGRKARRQEEEEDAADTTLSGKRAFEHYLLCFQLILWKQVHWLTSVQNFPAEFETIVRDLWALRLQTLQSRANYDSESEAELSSQMFSSQSEGEATDTTVKRKARRGKVDAVPQLVDALSLCYIGSLLLRLPTTVYDFWRWVASGELVYYRAVRTLSMPMKQRLPFNFNQALDPQITLQPSTLHRAALDNIVAYRQSYGMLTPPLNHILILYRWIGYLGLPLEVYAAVFRITKMLQIDFSYDMEAGKRRPRLRVLKLAEAKLMALLVIATKLLFPLDAVKRHPRKPTELSALAMDWSAWSAAREEHDQAVKFDECLGYEDALRVSEKDVLEMSTDKLDEYMDWYGSTITNEEVREKGRAGKEAEFRRAMFRYFPIDRPTEQTDEIARQATIEKVTIHQENRVKEVQASLKPIRVLEDDDTYKGEPVHRPGSSYKRYKDVSELSDVAEEFHKETAKLSGLSIDMLVQCVFSMERRLQEWEGAARRSHSMGGDKEE